MVVRLRVGVATPFTQIGADNDHPSRRFAWRRPRTVGAAIKAPVFQLVQSQAGASSPPSNNWIGAPGMMVEIACLYTSCEWPSRRSKRQKLSNQVTMPCSFTPFTRKIVSGVFVLRTWLRKVSCRFCARSAAIFLIPQSDFHLLFLNRLQPS